jgi:tungstate transport system ATP-binding protein
MPELGQKNAAGSKSALPLCLQGIHFRVDNLSLIEDLSLNLEAGGPTILVGPNGAGKSLLLRICHGLARPTKGQIIWGGGNRLSEATTRDYRRRQAMVFQRPVLLRRSVADNIEFALKLRGLGLPHRKQKVGRALEVAHLQHLAQRPAMVLSGGEQQRVALARAWSVDPEIMLLDEPSANLDPSSTRALEAVIEDISRAGTKILMATQDLGQARRLATDILLMHKGRLVERSTASDFFASPQSAEARAFLKGDLLI